jgi:uncharacterized protein DUF6649
MEVEDTKDRVFIHDLDEELADLESDDEHPIFIPDIEKHLVKIPASVLLGDDDRKKRDSMQLVLYNVPSSISVPKEKDSVRRAIIEARQRARDNQGLTIPNWPEEPSIAEQSQPPAVDAPPLQSMTPVSEADSDSMELG